MLRGATRYYEVLQGTSRYYKADVHDTSNAKLWAQEDVKRALPMKHEGVKLDRREVRTDNPRRTIASDYEGHT